MNNNDNNTMSNQQRLTNFEIFILEIELVNNPGKQVTKQSAVVVSDVDDPQNSHQ